MRTFAAGFQTAIGETAGTRFLVLCTITDPRGTPTVRRLASESIVWTDPTPDETYAGELLEVAGLYDALDGTGDVRLSIADTAANRAVVELGNEVLVQLLAGVTVTAPPFSPGADVTGDAELFLRGMVSDPIVISAGRIGFDVVSNDRARHNRPLGRTLRRSEFPGARPVDVGKMLPIVIGQIGRCEALGTDTGAVDFLVDEIGISDTTLELVDAGEFPTSGTVQIEDEQLAFTGKSGNELTGLTRGANSTTAIGHKALTPVIEVQSTYEFVLADHPIQRASAIYIDGARQMPGALAASTLNGAITDSATSLTVDDASGFPAKGSVYIGSEEIHYASITTNTLNSLTRGANGTTAAAHSDAAAVEPVEWQVDVDNSGRATLSFFSPLSLTRLASIEIDVSDTIEVADSGHSHTGASGGASASVGTITLEAGESMVDKDNVIDGDANTYGEATYISHGFDVRGEITNSVSGGTAGRNLTSYTVQVTYHLTYQAWIEINGFRFHAQYGSKHTESHTFYSSNWSEVTQTQFQFKLGGLYDPQKWYEFAITSISYQEDDSDEATANLDRTGGIAVSADSAGSDLVIGQLIEADIEGAVDDGSGTYTGTAGQLIERAAEVIHWLLDTYGELAADEGFDVSSDAGTTIAARLAERAPLVDVVQDLAQHGRYRAIYTGDVGAAGGWKIDRRKIAVAEADADTPAFTVGDSIIIHGDGGESTVSISRVGLAELANELTWYAGERGDGILLLDGQLEDTDAQADYGYRPAELRLPWLSVQADAAAAAAWYWARFASAHTRRVISLKATLAALELEPGDWVRVTSSKLGVDTLAEVVSAGPKALGLEAGASVDLVLVEFADVDPAWF